MNAKYNAILMCRDYMKYAAFRIDSVKNENYAGVLPILPKVDSNENIIAKPLFNEVVRLSSLVAERHTNSRYLDEAYLQLGKARYFKEDLINAIEVFKYVNTNAKTNKAKNEALIWLMRAYADSGDLKLAGEVAELLSTAELNSKLKAHYYLNRASYHQRNSEIPLAIVFLEEALGQMKKSKEKARAYYIAGQLYDYLGQTENARKNWIKVAKNKPDYDLEFNSGIALLMSGSLASSEANFEKMLEDRKNADLKEKIYFKKGEAELKKEQYLAAIESFGTSAELSSEKTQKANAYLKIAETYHLKLQAYEKASLYYDSTLFNLDTRASNFEDITKKALSLADFVKYNKALNLEDSLQRLAAMNPLALDAMIEKSVLEQEQEIKRLTEMAKEIAEKAASKEVLGSTASASTWFMYDQVSLSKARNAFIKQWGNRPLEDNWRRKEKEAGSISLKIERGIVGEEEKTEVVPNEEELAEKRAKELEAKKSQLKVNIPDTPVKLAQSKRRQQEALYQLGKIYKFQFEQEEEAKKVFGRLLNEHPNNPFEPEVLYFMALMSEVNSTYAGVLKEKYPQSSFARILQKGQVSKSAESETKAEIAYRALFDSFKQNNTAEALKLANEGLLQFTGSGIEDKFAFLRILLLGKTGAKNEYKMALEDFSRSYPASEMLSQAKEMLTQLK